MVDEFGHVWLIEINTSPDLSFSTMITRHVVSKLLRDIAVLVTKYEFIHPHSMVPKSALVGDRPSRPVFRSIPDGGGRNSMHRRIVSTRDNNELKKRLGYRAGSDDVPYYRDYAAEKVGGLILMRPDVLTPVQGREVGLDALYSYYCEDVREEHEKEELEKERASERQKRKRFEFFTLNHIYFSQKTLNY